MDKLNQWLTLVANLGVVAGIIFLAYEIQQNTNAMTTETTAKYLDNWIEITLVTATDPRMMELMQQVNLEGWENVSGNDIGRLGHFGSLNFKAAEFAYTQWVDGNLPDESWEGNHKGTYAYLWFQRWMRDMWQTTLRHNFGPRYRAYIDGMISEICTKQDCPPLPNWGPPNPDLMAVLDAPLRN